MNQIFIIIKQRHQCQTVSGPLNNEQVRQQGKQQDKQRQASLATGWQQRMRERVMLGHSASLPMSNRVC